MFSPKRFLTTLIALQVLSIGVSAFSFASAIQAIKIGADVVVAIAKTWNIVEEYVDMGSSKPMPPFLDTAERKLFQQILLVDSQLGEFQTEIEMTNRVTLSMIHQLPQRINLQSKFNELASLSNKLLWKNRLMVAYANASKIERLTLEDFATKAVSHDASSVRSVLEQIHLLIVPRENHFLQQGVLNLLADLLQEAEGDLRCNIQQSPQQLLYHLYNSIAVTELKGYAMMQFSWMLLKLYDKGNFTEEADIMRKRYEERTASTILAVKRAMAKSNRELWQCDPKQHVNGQTYVEVTELLQGFIQNEVDLNPEGTCRETCSEYTYTKSHGCYQNLYCRKQRSCKGKIVGCQYVDSDMWICEADKSTGRRYEYVEYENGRVLGRKTGCRRGATKVDSWWRWLFWHCSYCLCFCDEQGTNSDRYFNMRTALADVANNNVVTGLRFVKENRIIHLQIQEGKLLPRGNVDPDSVHWRPVDNYKITDRNVYNNKDYFTMTWEQRSMDLDDLKVEDGHVMTGVRFRKIGGHLNFEIQSSPFNFSSGELEQPEKKSMWKSNDNTDAMATKPRTRHRLTTPDVPTRSPNPSIPDSKSDTYLEFTHTDLDRDAAQTTVPFLDAQPVISQIATPLSGAGLYHKGRPDFGGFIAPKIITYDFSKHIQIAIQPDDVAVN